MANYQIQFGGVALDGANGWDEDDASRVVESIITRRDGARSDSAARKETRIINVTGVLAASSGTALRTALNTIRAALNGGKKALQLFDDQYINAEKKSFTPTYNKSGKIVEYTIQFVCTDPYFYENSLSTDTGNSVTGGSTTDVALVVGGNAPTPVVLTITPTTNALGSIWIYNSYSTIDKWCKFYTSETAVKVAVNSVLEIDTDQKICMRAGVNGLTYFSGEFFMLEGNATNTLKVLADQNVTINAEWRNRYF